MRDKIKDIDYFNKFIEEDAERVKKFENKINANEVKQERILPVKTKIHDLKLGILTAKYSRGDDIAELEEEYLRLLKGWQEVFCEEYYNKNLKMISLAVLFNVEEGYLNEIKEMLLKSGVSDWLLDFLINPMSTNKARELLFDDSFSTLKNAVYEENKEVLINKYLQNDWYCEDCGCYEAHKSRQNIYFGYWSFEAGAIVKILGINDISLKDTQYYPYDLVHYKNKMLRDKFEKGSSMEVKLVQKYETILPAELMKIWKECGLGSFLGGYLKVINPEEYQKLLNETYFRGNISIPILVTAFGDIITLEEGQYVGMVKYKNGNFVMLAKNFKRFVQNLEDDYFLDKYFQIAQYAEAVKVLGNLEQDECFGYVPLLGLGGSEIVNNLSKVKIREHIELITQMLGKCV